MKKMTLSRIVRWVLLALLLLWVTVESILHQVLGGGKSPSIHALCPYGALESLYALVISGTLLQKIYTGTFILLGITLLIAILFRRSFCGLLCPFGALQELFGKIGKALFKKRPVVPAKADKVLRYLKYGVLILTVLMAWRLGRLWMTSFDPYAAYGHIIAIPGTLAEDPLSIIGFVLLGITLLGSFIYDRFFCKYLCPAGAFYGLLGQISPTKIVRHEEACVHCGLCTKACPVNLDVATMDRVTSMECLNCNECVAACPKKGTLEIKTFKKTVSPLIMVVLVAALFFVPILVTQATGLFEVLPEKVGETAPADIGEIKGYMSIADAAKAVGMTDAQFRAVMKIPDTVPSTTLMKGIAELVPGYDFDAAKEAATGTTAAPVSPSAAVKGTDSPTPKVDASLVKGSMTIKDGAAALGMSEADYYKLFQIPAAVSPDTKMKDIVNLVPGYSFDSIKAAL